MELPLFSLLQDASTLADPGELEWEAAHDHAEGAYERGFRIADGQIILTIWLGKLHAIIYQTPLEDEIAIQSRNAELFEHYG